VGDLALVIIFNHRFDENIEKLVDIYAARFSNIFFLIPFYEGNDPRVIPVYESSIYFQGYVNQAFGQLILNPFKHYLFVADDLILNPRINEDNYKSFFLVDDDTAFIKELVDLHHVNKYWVRLEEAIQYNPNSMINRIDLKNLLPQYAEAARCFSAQGLTVRDNIKDFKVVYKKPELRGLFFSGLLSYFVSMLRYYKHRLLFEKNNGFRLYYPLVGANSDIFLIPGNIFRQFSHLCGIFSSTDLFVELALPTALVLSAKKIVTEKEINNRGMAIKGAEAINQFEGEYQSDLNYFLSHFPETSLFVHPIKLSRWHF